MDDDSRCIDSGPPSMMNSGDVGEGGAAGVRDGPAVLRSRMHFSR
mgnify:CR=1 FL=1